MKNRLLTLPPILLCLLVIGMSLLGSVYLASPLALAACQIGQQQQPDGSCLGFAVPTPAATVPTGRGAPVPSDATLIKQGAASSACDQAVADSGAGNTARQACAIAFKNGYKQVAESTACQTNIVCSLGYDAGQAARLFADQKAVATAGVSTTTIKALAKTSQACVAVQDNAAKLAACEKGYLAGYQGKSEAAACPAGATQAVCKAGFTAGKADKALGVTSAPEQAALSPVDPATAGGNKNVSSPDCQSGGDPLNWILCPIFDAVAGFTDFLFISVVEPLLKTTPVSTDPTSVAYQSWSSFRVYANALLVIALLVVVFGQSIGGGVVDAYTAKKVLPRLLVAAVLINLSIYIVAALVDITNIVGGSIGSVMTAPLKNAGAFVITPSGVQAGAIVGGAAAVGAIGAAALSVALLINLPILSFFLLFIIMPAVLGMLSAFITLILRQAIIVALVMVAPIAFALYCLPNTEKYFKKWWDFLLQTLLVYPIVVIFFAVSDILSVTVYQGGNNNNVAVGPLAAVISFVIQFLPLIFIPFAFKIAGGAVGRIHNVLSTSSKRGQEAVKGNANDPNSLRNNVRRKAMAGVIRARAQSFRNLNSGDGFGSKAYDGTPSKRFTRGIKGSIGNRAPGFAALLTGGAPAAESNLIEAAKQRINKIKDNGDDTVVNARASFIEEDRNSPNYGKRTTLDGKPVTEMSYRAAMQQHPTLGELQAVSEYRLGKVTNSEQGEQFARNYGTMAKQQGLTLEEANGNMKGFTFGKQNEAGHLKYGALDDNYEFHGIGDNKLMERKPVSPGVFKDSLTDDFVNEQYFRKSGYTAAQQTAPYWHSTGKAQQQYLSNLQGANLDAMTPDQQRDYDKVKQIVEGQKNFETPSLSVDKETNQPLPAGLGNASPATKAAFEQVKAMRSAPAHAAVVRRVEADLAAGRTYESEHSANSRTIK